MADIVKEVQAELEATKQRQANERYAKAVTAVRQALLYDPHGLTAIQLQQKARLSIKTLNDVLNRTNQVREKGGKYFLAGR